MYNKFNIEFTNCCLCSGGIEEGQKSYHLGMSIDGKIASYEGFSVHAACCEQPSPRDYGVAAKVCMTYNEIAKGGQ